MSTITERLEEYAKERRKQELEERFKKSGLPESYRDRFMNNPYWDMYYSTPGSENDNFLGFRTGTAKDMSNLRLRAVEEEEQWINEYAQNQYNSPLQSSARENAAGLNSALLGIGDANSDVGNPAEEYPTEIGNQDLRALDIANPFLKMAEVSLSLASGFKQLKGLGLDNDLKSTSIYQSIGDIADSAAAASITPATFEAIDKLSEEEKAGLIAGDSKFDDILEASVKTSDAADAWIKSFPVAKTKKQQRYLDKLRSEFVLRRNSVFRQARSWEDFTAMRKSIADPANQDFANYSKYMKSALEFEQASLDVEMNKKYAESLLWNDEVFNELWRSNEFAKLRSELTSNILQTTHNQFDQAVLDGYVNDPETISNASDAEKEAIRAKLSQMIALYWDGQLAAHTKSIRDKYFTDFEDNPFIWQFKYRSLSPQTKVYKEAKGQDSSPDISGGAAKGIDFLLKYLGL